MLNIPAGNCIAIYAFATVGYEVIDVEPDNSELLGEERLNLYLKH